MRLEQTLTIFAFFCLLRKDGSSSRSLLPLLQKQTVPEVEVQPWCTGSQGAYASSCIFFLSRPSHLLVRSASTTSAANVPPSTTSPSAATSSQTNTNNSPPKRSKPPASAPTNTSPRSPARTRSTCACACTRSTSSGSIRCYPARAPIDCKRGCEARGGNRMVPRRG